MRQGHLQVAGTGHSDSRKSCLNGESLCSLARLAQNLNSGGLGGQRRSCNNDSRNADQL